MSEDQRAVVPATPQRPRLWRAVLGLGVALWVVTVLALWLTKNTALVPSVIFLGSFLTPLTLTVWLVERERYTGVSNSNRPSELTVPLLAAAFLACGVLGVAVSALLESIALKAPASLYLLWVAAIEESVKLAAVWWLARGFTTYSRRDGMVLGACVGFGFAAFESAGVAFNALIQTEASDAQHLLTLIESEVVRGLLTPVGHGLWTALLGGALFAAARNGHLRVTRSVVGWWFLVVFLHFVWDEAVPLSQAVTDWISDNPVTLKAFEANELPAQSEGDVRLAAVIQTIILLCCAAPALWLARREWIKGRARVPGYPHAPTS